MLLLAPFAPRLDATHGGGRAMAQLVRALGARESVGLVCCRADDEPPIDPRVAECCEWVEEVRRPWGGPAAWRRLRLLAGLACGRPTMATRWRVPGLAARVAARTREWAPAVVQAEYHVMTAYFPPASSLSPPAVRVLVEYEPGVAGASNALEAAAWRRWERRALERCDAVVAFTARDRRSLEALGAGAPVVEIALGAEIPAVPLDPRGREGRVLFVGNCMHPPNRDAAARLARAVLPLVRRRMPGATLDLVGDAPTADVLALGGDGVTVHGRVPAVEPFLDAAAVVVAPLRLGGGMRVKVLEALAAGKAVVATPLAVEGLALRDGEQVLLGESDEELAAAVARLLEEPARRAALAAGARAWAVAHLGWPAVADAYGALYDRLLAAGPRPGRAP